MNTKQLPPNLSSLHDQLSIYGGNHASALRLELDAVSEVIAHSRKIDPHSSALTGIEMLKKSFTGTTGGQTACKCCGRPF